ncbi:MAG: DUF3168 domain-containing protein [Pseudomonadota bacterium]
MSDHGLALQEAAHARLISDPGIQSILGSTPRIYDIPPRKPVYPFVSYGEWRVGRVQGVPDHFEHNIRLRIFSRYEGRSETRAVMAALHDALQDAPLTMSNRTLVSIRFVFSDVFLRADGRVWNGVMRFRAVDTMAN